jgi:uncharacterized protein YgiM (DUF1202 family)
LLTVSFATKLEHLEATLKRLLLAFLLLIIFTTLVSAQDTYYIKSKTAKARSCAGEKCDVVATLTRGTPITVLEVVKGTGKRAKDWLHIQVDGKDAFVIITAATKDVPMSQAPAGGSGCPGITLTCTKLSSCDQAKACLAAGNKKLDKDGDGIPCESLCK